MTQADTDSFQDAKLWDLPSVDQQLSEDDAQTNALNKPKNAWKYEAPEPKEDIKPLTAQEIESIREAAYQEGLLSGHEEGFAKGQAEGFEKGQKEGLESGKQEGSKQGLEEAQSKIEEQASCLRNLFDNLQAPITQVNDELKKELVILSTTIAKSIVQVECKQNEEVILQAISQGIKMLPLNEARYQISVNKDDLALLNEHLKKQDEQNWQLIEDESLARGGCKIQTTANAVDVSIEKRTQSHIMPILLNQGLGDDPRTS